MYCMEHVPIEFILQKQYFRMNTLPTIIYIIMLWLQCRSKWLNAVDSGVSQWTVDTALHSFCCSKLYCASECIYGNLDKTSFCMAFAICLLGKGGTRSFFHCIASLDHAANDFTSNESGILLLKGLHN